MMELLHNNEDHFLTVFKNTRGFFVKVTVNDSQALKMRKDGHVDDLDESDRSLQ